MSDTDTAATPTVLPRLNEPAPDFTQDSTAGPISLSDLTGRWLVLFSHPADFTPVCTTEFLGFAELAGEFAARDVQLVGLSVDSVHSHIAWMKNIEANFGVEITFPILADLDMSVARRYGMIQPGASATAAVRAVFVIDPEGILRAMIYYPLTTGRNMREILRLIDALQCNTRHGLATPANWAPGEACIVPPPATKEAADKRPTEGYETVDWYFSRTPQPAD